MPNANPLIDDIEDDYHQHLLTSGNLVKRPPAVSWSDENRWTSRGYLARVLRTVCACGTSTDSLVGIFHEESTPSGKIRSQALDLRRFQVTLGENYPILIQSVTSAVCPSCLSSKGFSLGDPHV